MKILFYQWNAYNLYDIRLTLEQMGHEVTMLSKPIENAEEDAIYANELSALLKKSCYDFLFSINYFPILAEACHNSGTRYVCWNCDSPLLALYHESVFYPTNIIFTFDRSNLEEIRALGVTNIFYLPLAVNTERLAKQIRLTNIQKYPVSFVGSLYEKNSYDKIADKLPAYLCGYLEGAMNAQNLISGGNLLETLLTDDICLMLEDIMEYHQSERSFASVRNLFASTVLGFKAASIERHRNLNRLSLFLQSDFAKNSTAFFKNSPATDTREKSLPLHLFTNSTVENMPFTTVHGPVDYLSEMPQIFYDSKINLNMTIPNIKTGIPLRVWDILGSGGFVLSNYQPEFDEYFKAGQTLDIFEEEEELLDKTAFYLKNDSLRQKIAKQGLELVAKEHTYKIRLTKLFEILKQF